MGIVIPLRLPLTTGPAEHKLLEFAQSILELDTRVGQIRDQSRQPLVWSECHRVVLHLEDVGLAIGIIEQRLQEVAELTREIERHHAR